MAPLPPEGTPRFRFGYDVDGVAHDFQVRSHASPSAIGALVHTFLTALDPALFEIQIGVVNFAADNSNIFLPVTTGIEGNIYGSGSPNLEQRPWFYGFQGRGASGRKWHLDIFGALSLGTNYRWTPGEYTVMDNAVAALQTFGTNLVDIADAQVTVYNYVNAGSNSYWQRAQR